MCFWRFDSFRPLTYIVVTILDQKRYTLAIEVVSARSLV